MITLPFQFEHPFCEAVSFRRLECQPVETFQLHDHCNDPTAFAILLPITEDGGCQAIPDRGHENRQFSRRSDIRISTGQLTLE